MKKIGFVGSYDKTDFILYLAKIFSVAGKKVLIVDTTNNQKAKYVIPVLSPSMSYITNYKGIDIAVGLYSFEEINGYLGLPSTAVSNYDYVFIDIDKAEVMESFNMIVSDYRFFVTSMDLFSLKRGLETLSGLENTLEMSKIYFTHGNPQSEDDYLNFLSLGYKVAWNNEKVYFPLETSDLITIIQNQREEDITIKNLSPQYKDALIYLAEMICEEDIKRNIKKIVKMLERLDRK